MTLFLLLLYAALFLCWGSFLNVLAYRFIFGQDIIWSRSCCPQCTHQLAWYDLIPVVSWLLLRAQCRYCFQSISWLYPVIELLTACLLLLMTFILPSVYFIGYTLFISALIIVIRTDIETMLISRFTTLYIIPVAYILSFTCLLPITLTSSIFGSFMGYGILWGMGKLFYYIKNTQGLGEGDSELLATIGAFTGPWGAWIALLIGSLLGTLTGLLLYMRGKIHANTKIPFGPMLAIGALCYLFASHYILAFLYY